MRASPRTAASGLVALCVLAVASPAAAAPLSFVSTESVHGAVLHPQLRARFSDGTTATIPPELVFDTTIDEAIEGDDRSQGVLLDVTTKPGARRATLLAFDAKAWLEGIGKGTAQIEAVDLVIHRAPTFKGRLDRRLGTRLQLYAKPVGGTWVAPTLGELALTWAQAEVQGLTPAPSGPPYDAVNLLATAFEGDRVRAPDPTTVFPGGEGFVQSVSIRFFGDALTGDVISSANAGLFARFVVFAQDGAGASAGLDSGPKPSSRSVDAMGSLRHHGVPSPPFALAAEAPLPGDALWTNTVERAAVGSDDTLYLIGIRTNGPKQTYGAKLVGVRPGGLVASQVDLETLCGVCAEPPLAFGAESMHVLADGTLAIVYGLLAAGAEESQLRVMKLQQLGGTFSLVADHPLPELDPIVGNLQNGGVGGQVRSVVGPKGTIFVHMRDHDPIDVADFDPFKGRLVEINPASGAIVEHVLPDTYAPANAQSTSVLPPFITPEGHIALAWTNPPVNDPVAHAIRLDPSTDEVLAAWQWPGLHLATSAGVTPNGLHHVVTTPSGAITELTLRSLGADGSEAAVSFPAATFIGHDDRDRLVFGSGNGSTAPTLIDPAGGKVVGGERWVRGPNVLFDGGLALAWVQSPTILMDTDGRPLSVPGPAATQPTQFLAATSEGFYALLSFGTPAVGFYGPADRYFIEDLPPFDAVRGKGESSFCPLDANDLPTIDDFVLLEATLPAEHIVNYPKSYPDGPGTRIEWVTTNSAYSSGGGGYYPYCLPDCFETPADILCPGPGTGPATVYPGIKDGASNVAPGFEELWVTARRVHIVDEDDPAFLKLEPNFGVISVGDSVTVNATKGGAPAEVTWRVIRGADKLAIDLEGTTGTSAELDPLFDARPGSVVLEAEDADGERNIASFRLVFAPRLKALVPDPNPSQSTIEEGGGALRYYRAVSGPADALDADLEHPVLTAHFTVDETGETFTAHTKGFAGVPGTHVAVVRDLRARVPGLLVVGVPWSAIAGAPGETRTVHLSHFVDRRGTELAPLEPHSFTITIEPREVEKRLDLSNSLLVGPVPLLKLIRSAGGSVGIVESDGQPGIDRGTASTTRGRSVGLVAALSDIIGLTLELKSPLGGIGGPEIKGFLSASKSEDFVFEPYDVDPDALSAALADVVAALAETFSSSIATNPLAPASELVELIADLVLPGQLDPTRAARHFSVAFKFVPLDISLTLELPGLDESELFLEFVGVNIEAAGQLTLSLLGEPLGGGVRLRLDMAQKFEFSELSIGGIAAAGCQAAGDCKSSAFFEEVEVDPEGQLRAVRLGLTDDKGNAKVWTVPAEEALEMLRSNCGKTINGLAALAGCVECFCLDPGTIGNLALSAFTLAPTFAADSLEGVLGSLATTDDVTFSQDAVVKNATGGVFGGSLLGVGFKVSGSVDIVQTTRGTVGVLKQGGPFELPITEFPLEAYSPSDGIVPPIGDLSTLEPELSITNLLTAAFQETLIGSLLTAASDFLAGVEGQLVHPPPPAPLSGDVFPEPPHPASAYPMTLNATWTEDVTVEASVWAPDAPASTRNDAGLGDASVEALVGYFHDFHQVPAGAATVDGTISLGYGPDDPLGYAPEDLEVAWWDPDAAALVTLPSTADPLERTVTADLAGEGIYVLAYRGLVPCPTLDPPVVSADSVALSWPAATDPQIIGWSLYRSAAGGTDLERLAILDAAQTSYEDADLSGEVGAFRYALAPRVWPEAEGCLSEPVVTDGDGDQISDLYELALGLAVGIDNSATDADGDGASDLEEAMRRTDPLSVDTDGDGLDDATELADPDSDPRTADSDHDGLDDFEEVAFGTGVRSYDSDRDGLADGAEIALGTDPLAADSDGDRLGDKDELDLFDTDPAAPDTDADGLDDLAELLLGTDPSNADTDEDSYDDGEELARGTNPLDAGSTPDGPGPEPDPGPEPGPEAGPEADPGADPEPGPEADPGSEADAEADAQPGTDADAGPGPQADAEAESQTERPLDAETGPEDAAGSEPDAGPDPELDPDAETGPGAGPESDAADDEGGCSCQSSPAPGTTAWLGLVALGLWWRRRSHAGV